MAKDVGERLFTTVSGVPVERLYVRKHQVLDYEKDLGDQDPPYTRGIYPTMYRGRLWTMRQFSGFRTARNQPTSITCSITARPACRLPSDFDGIGLGSSDVGGRGRPMRRGDRFAFRHGNAFRGIPLDQISTSMTTNAPATILWSMYLVVAEKQGVDWKKLRGTIQNDILKEYIAQKTYLSLGLR